MLPWVGEVSLGVSLGMYADVVVSEYGDPRPSVVVEESLLSVEVGLILALNSSQIAIVHWYLSGRCGGVLLMMEFGLK